MAKVTLNPLTPDDREQFIRENQEAFNYGALEEFGLRDDHFANKEYEKYQQYQTDRLHGRILTPDGLRVICAGLDNDPEKIGIHMLEMLAKFRSESLFDIVVDDE